jgi:hypothetical protein
MEEMTAPPVDSTTRNAWDLELEAAVCERCDWTYLLPPGSLPRRLQQAADRCPRCFQNELMAWSGSLDELPQASPPELVAPHRISAAQLAQAVQNFANGIPFAPPDLNPKNLQARLRRLYLPAWLVDAKVRAEWQAEAGFDYQVVSHQDRYEQNRGGWASQQIKEDRIRWEPRVGRLERSYHNIPAPALEEALRLQKTLGKFDLSLAAPYQPETLQGAYVRLPNRAPQDAWSDAQAGFQAAAAQECRQAAGADHLRQFSWRAEYDAQNWTLLLLPVYTTYYQDDENRPQPVLIHGQSGKLTGLRRASMKRAQRAALAILGAAAVVFLLSLLLSVLAVALPALLAVGVFGLAMALLLGMAAIYPPASVWWFNKNEPPG